MSSRSCDSRPAAQELFDRTCGLRVNSSSARGRSGRSQPPATTASLGFRDLLAQVLFQDPVHPRPHPPFSRQPSVVFPSDRLGTATSPGSDNCFPTSSGAIKDSPVWFPPGRARLATNLIIADPLKGQRGSSFLLPPVLPELPAPGESRRMIYRRSCCWLLLLGNLRCPEFRPGCYF